jgi:hypothetical protein
VATLGIAIGAALAAATPASAYVRARTGKGIPVHWTGGCVFMQPDAGATADLANADTLAAIQRSIDAWTSAVGSAAYLALTYQTPAGPLDSKLDGRNTIKFRSDHWCPAGDASKQELCYSEFAAGITTVRYVDDGSKKAGEIEDADIELNDVNFFFAVLSRDTPSPDVPAGRTLADLENTLVHELGHVMGLDHTCSDDNTPPQEVDDSGQPPPRCDSVKSLPADEQAKITGATMYNTYQPGEISKRMPKADDVAGIANAYPPADDPKACKATDLGDFNTGCSLAGRRSRSLGAIGMLVCALVALRLRRRTSDCAAETTLTRQRGGAKRRLLP